MVALPLDGDDFDIAVICALKLEYDAIALLADRVWGPDEVHYERAPEDLNLYTMTRMGEHNVVLVCLAEMGKVSAASAAPGLRASFPSVSLCCCVESAVVCPGRGHQMSCSWAM
jgi:hypothetical protein